MRRLYPMAGRAHLVGITGPPGAGKSTLVAALIAEVRRAGRTVAVVAVDPSSPITGGALLGDRVRMQAYAADDDVFIRSMASRGPRRRAGVDARRRPRPCSTRPASTSSSSRRSAPARARSRSPPPPTRPSSSRRPRWATRSRRSRPGLLEVADLVVVNKGDKPGRPADRGAAPGDARGDRRGATPSRRRAAPPEAARGPDHDGRDRRRRAGAASPRSTATARRAAREDVSARGPPGPRRGAGLGDRGRPPAGPAP